MEDEFTTIRVSKGTLKRLSGLKVHPRQTMDEAVNMLADGFESARPSAQAPAAV